MTTHSYWEMQDRVASSSLLFFKLANNRIRNRHICTHIHSTHFTHTRIHTHTRTHCALCENVVRTWCLYLYYSGPDEKPRLYVSRQWLLASISPFSYRLSAFYVCHKRCVGVQCALCMCACECTHSVSFNFCFVMIKFALLFFVASEWSRRRCRHRRHRLHQCFGLAQFNLHVHTLPIIIQRLPLEDSKYSPSPLLSPSLFFSFCKRYQHVMHFIYDQVCTLYDCTAAQIHGPSTISFSFSVHFNADPILIHVSFLWLMVKKLQRRSNGEYGADTE